MTFNEFGSHRHTHTHTWDAKTPEKEETNGILLRDPDLENGKAAHSVCVKVKSYI